MENTLEKVFINRHLGIKFKSYIDEDCNVWFKAKEVAQILGYKNTVDVIKRHVSENHKRTFLLTCPRETRDQVFKDKKSCPPETGGQVQGRWIIFIDEPGFYELVFKSKLPAAKMFREWVFSKVLLSIRKYGYYNKIKKENKRLVMVDGVEYYKHQIFSDYAANKDGDIYSLKRKKIINKNKDSNGYLFFFIYNKKLEKQKFYNQHRFVYEVFRGPIPHGFELDHIFPVKSDNRIKNLQLLTHKQNVEKSNNRPIISTCISTGKERRFISIKKAAIDLDINSTYISNICCKRKSYKTATSKKDNQKYTFRYLD